MRRTCIAIVLLCSACTDPAGLPTTTPAPGSSLTVDRVLDGDSLVVRDGGEELDVRLLGINAPERDECHAERSRAALTDLVESGPVALASEGTDQFGRRLGYVTAGGEDVNLALVAAGAALATGGDHPRRAAYLAAEETAYDLRAGLWQPDACGPATAGLDITGVAADPDGPDDQNLSGEWADIVNDGAAAVDLTGWVLRDDSSTHRFGFPDRLTLAPGRGVRVFVGCGTDDGATLFWCHDSPVWNNAGDAALLLDAAGNVAARLRYRG